MFFTILRVGGAFLGEFYKMGVLKAEMLTIKNHVKERCVENKVIRFFYAVT